MGDIADRVTQARREIVAAAIERWQRHQERRVRSRLMIERDGPGAASSAAHRAQYSAREMARRAAGVQGRPGLEQMIGKSWDASIFAPSEQARALAKPVARIVTMPGPGYHTEGVATGFLVTPRLLLTNHHVLPDRCYATGLGANFLCVIDETGEQEGIYFNLDPDLFYLSDQALDFALVGVSPRGTRGEAIEELGTIRLLQATGKTLVGYPVNIIQHPKGGARQYATMNNRLVDILEEGYLHYETDTAYGSSGSPVFSGKWELIALHHCGIPLMKGNDIIKKNGDVWDREQDSEDQIQWVANEGTRVSFIVDHLQKVTPASLQERKLLDELLLNTTDPLAYAIPDIPLPPASSNKESLPMSQNLFNISGSVTINVYEPKERHAVETAPQVADRIPDRVEEKALNFDPDYPRRGGYQEMFLGVRVPAPAVEESRQAELYSVKDYRDYFSRKRTVPEIPSQEGADAASPLVLPYHNYSLVMNKTFRMVMWAASNVDYRSEQRQDRRPRKELGDETWRADPRVPLECQMVNQDIYGPAMNLDRGHIVRREDNCWGPPGLATEYHNSDTYHWTNCTPQHELFNQESPKGVEYRGRKGAWGFFEDKLADQIEKGGGQAVLFAGPVLDGSCREKDFGRGTVKYPTKFWKVVVVPEDDVRDPKLLVYGFLFDQTKALDEFGVGFREAIDLRRDFGREARSLKAISKIANIQFAQVLHEADQHAELNDP